MLFVPEEDRLSSVCPFTAGPLPSLLFAFPFLITIDPCRKWVYFNWMQCLDFLWRILAPVKNLCCVCVCVCVYGCCVCVCMYVVCVCVCVCARACDWGQLKVLLDWRSKNGCLQMCVCVCVYMCDLQHLFPPQAKGTAGPMEQEWVSADGCCAHQLRGLSGQDQHCSVRPGQMCAGPPGKCPASIGGITVMIIPDDRLPLWPMTPFLWEHLIKQVCVSVSVDALNDSALDLLNL